MRTITALPGGTLFPSLLSDPVVRHLRDDDRQRILCNLLRITCETFVETADQDYALARMSYFEGSANSFLWHGLHSVEKYMKAIVRTYEFAELKRSHNIVDLSQSIEAKRPDLITFDVSESPSINEWDVPFSSIDRPAEFIQWLNENGAPRVRYNLVPIQIDLSNLVYLDRLVHSLRSEFSAANFEGNKKLSATLNSWIRLHNVAFYPDEFGKPDLHGVPIVSAHVSILEAALNGLYGHPAVYSRFAESLLMSPDEINRLKKSADRSRS